MAFTAPETDIVDEVPQATGFTAPESDLAPQGGFTAPPEDGAFHVERLANDWTNYDPHVDDANDYNTRAAVILRRQSLKRPVADTVGKTVQAVGGAAKGVIDFVKAPFQAVGATIQGVRGALSDDPAVTRAAGKSATELNAAAQLGAMGGVETAKKIAQVASFPARFARGAVDALQTGKPLQNSAGHEMGGWITPDTLYTADGIKAELMKQDAMRKEREAVSRGDYASSPLNRPAYTPEQLAQTGNAVDPATVESMGMAFDPTNLIPGLGIPGANVIGGKALQAAGKVAQAPARVAGAVATRIPGIGLASRFVPKQQIAEAATLGTARAGRFIEQTGKELAGDALAPADRGLFASGAARLVKGSAEGASSMLPFAASQDTPEEAAATVATGAGIGAGFGLAKNPLKSRFENTDRTRTGPTILSTESFDYNSTPDLDAQHNQAASRMSPEQRNEVNQIRHLTQGNLEYYVLPEAEFNARAQEHGQETARGFYETTGPEGKRTVFVKEGTTDPIQTGWHEVGHDITATLDPAVKARAIAALVRGNDMDAFASRYLGALGEPGSESSTWNNLSPEQRQRLGEELLSEQTAALMRGQNIDTLAKGRPVLKRQLQQLIGRIAESFGYRMTAPEARSILGVNPSFTAAAIIEGALGRMAEGAGVAPAYGGEVTVANRMAQLEPVAGRTITPEMTMPDRQAILDARRELRTLQSDIAPESPTTPATPTVAPEPPATVQSAAQARLDAASALKTLGIDGREAHRLINSVQDQIGKQADAQTIIRAALQVRETGKISQPAAVTAPSNVPEPRPNVPPPESTETATAGARTTQSAVAEAQPEAPPAPAAPEPAVRRTYTPEEIKALVDTAEAEARAKETGKPSKAGDARVHAAKVKAVLDAIGTPETGLQRNVDEFGAETIKGDFDPANPLHAALAELGGGVTPEAAEVLQKTQQAAGQARYIRYRAAKSHTVGAGEGEADFGMRTRTKEYSSDPSQERKDGTVQHKVIVPVGTEFTKDGRPIARFYTLDNLLHNADSAFAFADQNGIETGYPERSGREEQLFQDAQDYAENHANGYRGDGKPIEQFPDTGLPRQNPDYVPKTIPEARLSFLNMLFADEGSTASARQAAKARQHAETVAAGGKSRKPPEVTPRARASELEAVTLAQKNQRWVDPDTGETNRLRKTFRDAGFDFGNEFKSPLETLSPEHILEIGESPLTLQQGDVPSVRPTGFTGDPAKLAAKGLPKAKAVRAAFMPETLYRASSKDEQGIRAWSSWSPDKDTATAYLDNPGFGGDNIRTVKVNRKKVLEADVRSRSGMRRLAEELGFDPEKGDEWVDNGWQYPWEESTQVRRAIEESGFDWVEYVDDFPQGAKTTIPVRDVPDAKFQPEDTGKPGESPHNKENLAREAEEAGIVLSKETLLGLLREDENTLAAVRKRIRDKTGRDARFMPDLDKKDTKSIAKARIENRAANKPENRIQLGNAQISNGPIAVFMPEAYHGTPHKVDKFSTKNIGTGEGAQSYGWGLYFAENRKVAEAYKEEFRERKIDEVAADLESLTQRQAKRKYKIEEGMEEMMDGDEDDIVSLAGMIVDSMPNSENIYTVHIDAEPEHLLEWDKPLSKQSEQVREGWYRAMVKRYGGKRPKLAWDITGAEAHDMLAGGLRESKEASQLLNSEGVHGIRYADQGSRGKTEESGTSNYVIFDESKIRITHENGKPVSVSEFMPVDGSKPKSRTKEAARQRILQRGGGAAAAVGRRELVPAAGTN